MKHEMHEAWLDQEDLRMLEAIRLSLGQAACELAIASDNYRQSIRERLIFNEHIRHKYDRECGGGSCPLEPNV